MAGRIGSVNKLFVVYPNRLQGGHRHWLEPEHRINKAIYMEVELHL